MRYIEVDEAVKHFMKWEFTDDFLLIKQIFDGIPSADVIKVVRCKDCKHNVINHGRHCTFGDCIGCLVADDFFCKYGERKETK